ncbi:MAG TPA: SUMF1/EgtB/PvdO family nonheme iron enzyme, partial [Polyangiaceae bacterium]|nr:SUMF1/EgtB/PvdO family nonheme iron enzyme [Polyangiaceae bacterium]
MRFYPFLLAALLAACTSGNNDHQSAGASGGSGVGPATCRLNSNCAKGEVCIFQTCGPACNGDEDCAKGSRCLNTDTGTACVSSSAATCDAGCPAGTTCSPTDGACRNACDTTECLAGQACMNGVCVGADQHEMGAGGGAGASGGSSSGASSGGGGSSNSGGSSNGGASAAGAGGAQESDPCVGMVCDAPPAPSCASPSQLTTYGRVGSCSKGTCSYTPNGLDCAFGCTKDACNPDPCEAVACHTAPANTCKNASTKTTYTEAGTCSGGKCSYPPTDTACGTNQHCGGAGVCSVCKADASCGASCTACAAGTPKCKDLGATSMCVACLSNADCSGEVCNTTTNVCEPPPSCAGLAATCGPSGNAGCCASSVVTGGSFNRANDANYPATVSDFRLDTYEVTVGRFRKFVAAYSQTMIQAGKGKNPSNVLDPGWDSSWNASLDTNATTLKAALNCAPGYQTWTDAAGSAAEESLPINCVDWFEAEAFCIWDGGRVPTDAEWNYAAEGGAAQRQYPWGSAAPDCSHSNYYDLTAGFCTTPPTGGVNRVGSESPTGDGLYGQADL